MARIGGSCGLQPRWRSCSARSVPPPRRSLCCGREQLAHNGSLSLDSFRARQMRMMAEFSHIRESPPLPETREPEGTFMKFTRQNFLHLAAAAVALPAFSPSVWAQTYPSRPVRVIVGFAPGGAPDIVARLLGPTLSQNLGQSFFVENRTGAGSNIATEAVVNAPPDGYTLLLVSPPNFVNATLYERLNYNFLRDIAPVAALVRVPNVMEVHPSVPAKTVPEFVAYAKANPDKLNMASGGNGTSVHMAGELFKMMTGVRMPHVPYRGVGAAYPDLLAGQVQVMFDSTPGSIEFIRSGRLRALGLAALTRSPALPDLPTIGEFVPGYESSALHGVGAPRDTPVEIIDKLNKAINVALAEPEIKARLVDMGATVLGGSPEDFGKLMVAETEKWAKVVKFSGAKPE